MRPVSAAFLRTLTGSHNMIARATVCETFQTGTQPTGERIPILGGDVSLDGTADKWATLSLTTAGAGRWPAIGGDLTLAPYGNEIYVERGIAYSDIDFEYVGLGYFRIDSPEQDEAPDGPITIAAPDRMAGIIDARLLAPRQFAAGVTLGSVFDALVLEVYPAAVIVWDDGSAANTLARSMICTEDRFGFLNDIVRSLGKIWHWNHRGELSIRAVPDPASPVVEVMSGRGGVLLSLSRRLTRERVYNAVVATGEATDTAAPVRGVAYDNNVNSPTYFFGRFGPVPRFYTSSLLATDAQATAAATAMLRRELGLPYVADFTATPNPALEPWDAVRTRARDDQGAETHVLETLTIPLVQSGALSATTREQTVVLIGTS